MHGDWKSADEIEADLKAGEHPDWQEFVADLWRRIDELQERVAALEREREERQKDASN